MKKTQVFTNKPVYLGLPILQILRKHKIMLHVYRQIYSLHKNKT